MSPHANQERLLQLSAGRGPAECRRAVHHLLGHLTREAARSRCMLRLVEAEPDPDHPRCYASAIIAVSGPDTAWTTILLGTHLWICESPFRPRHKRKNWYVSVSQLDKPEATSLPLSEVQFTAVRAAGPGGQHVNKTATAVRAAWTRDGTAVTASGERSQAQNKRLALAKLRALVEARNRAAESAAKRSAWQDHDQLVRGQPVRIYVGNRFKRRQ